MATRSSRTRFRLGSALLWASSWAFGAAMGVALGGWLTAVGGSGAPGIEGIQPVTDLVLLPAVAFGAVFLVNLGFQVLVAIVRRPLVAPAEQ